MVAKYSGKLRVERDGVTSALLVLNNTTGEGILVNSEGSAYARYSAYLPFAKPYLDYEIARIADYCVSEGAENTSDGLWAITFDEVCEHFKLLTLGLDCLRLCGAMEREQTVEQTAPLAMTM